MKWKIQLYGEGRYQPPQRLESNGPVETFTRDLCIALHRFDPNALVVFVETVLRTKTAQEVLKRQSSVQQ